MSQQEDVLELVQLSDQIRRARRDRAYQIQWERERRGEGDRRRRYRRAEHDDEAIIEREVIYDRREPVRGYLR